MAPGSSSSSAITSKAGFYANDRSFFIDGVEHTYRDLDQPAAAEDSRIALRPPFLAAPDFQQELRYTIPGGIKPDGSAPSGPPRGPHSRRKPIAARPSSVPESDIICLLYTSPSPRDRQKSRMPSSA